jgi:hypothetical protein
MERDRSKTPTTWVSVAFHDTSLHFGDNPMIACREFNGGHLCNTKRNGFTYSTISTTVSEENTLELRTFGSHEDDFFMKSDICLITQQSWYHEFCTITNCVDGTVFHDDSFVSNHQTL